MSVGPQEPDPSEAVIPGPKTSAGLKEHEKAPQKFEAKDAHPSGRESYGRLMQFLRGLSVMVFFWTCILAIFVTQLIGVPLYLIKRDMYYAYMAMTKRYFAIVTSCMTNIWGPTTIRISGDATVMKQIEATRDGGVQFNFPERIVLIANHQIYTDWVYLWWVAYGNLPRMDGHLYIILKESLMYLPFLGWGMLLYGFIFMSRKMATDRPRLAYRLGKLSQKKFDPQGNSYLDPMWLLLFPEGTNLSGNGRRKSAAWAAKNGLKDPEHVLLPRSTGIYFCIQELKDTVEYVYDCTVAYEGIPRGKFGEQFFSLSSTYFQGRPPKSVNFHWRRFRIADIPLDNAEEFDVWLREVWYRKDELMEEYLTNGRLPPMEGGGPAYVEAEVKTKSPLEILQVFVVPGICALVWNNIQKSIQAAKMLVGM